MKTILFVCVHNAGRSVMAEAFANALGGSSVRAVSAGTVPGGSAHPEVVSAMSEVGIDVSGHRGRAVDDALVRDADRVITMGCAVDEESCPAIFLKDVEDWGLPDPKGRSVEQVREIRDEVKRRVEALLAEL